MSGAVLTDSDWLFSACRCTAERAVVALSNEGVCRAMGINIRQISFCIPEWHAVIWEASLMKWCRSDFCSAERDENGSTGLANEGGLDASEDLVV